MKEQNIKRAIREVAKGGMAYARYKGYGLGELGPYWRESAEEYSEDKVTIDRIMQEARDLAYKLDEAGIKSFN